MSIYHTLNKSLCEIFDVEYNPKDDYEQPIVIPDDNPFGVGQLNPFYGKKHTNETKALISLIHKGKTISEYQKQKISESNRTRKYTPERNGKISKARMGMKFSEETKKKMKLQASNRKKIILQPCLVLKRLYQCLNHTMVCQYLMAMKVIYGFWIQKVSLLVYMLKAKPKKILLVS